MRNEAQLSGCTELGDYAPSVSVIFVSSNRPSRDPQNISSANQDKPDISQKKDVWLESSSQQIGLGIVSECPSPGPVM